MSGNKVFIAYTGQDLDMHADAARTACRRKRWVAVDHRDWEAVGERSVQRCFDEIDACDALIVLVANRYGWVPTKDDHPDADSYTSITWLEVKRAATVREIPVVRLILAGGHAEGRAREQADPSQGPYAARLADFKESLRKSIVREFTDPASVEPLVYAALTKIEQDGAAAQVKPLTAMSASAATRQGRTHGRRALLAASLLVVIALVGIGAALQVRQGRIEAARCASCRENWKRLDNPYTLHTAGAGLPPSANPRVIPRRFRWIDLAQTAVGLPLGPGTVGSGFEELKTKVSDALASEQPLIAFTGRFGSGVGYAWAHVIARLVEDAESDSSGKLRISGRERWMHFVETHTFDTAEPPYDDAVVAARLRRSLAEKVPDADFSDEVLFRGAMLLVGITPARNIPAVLRAMSEFASRYGACVMIGAPPNMVERWSPQDLRRGVKFELFPYDNDAASQRRIFTVALRDRIRGDKQSPALDPEVAERYVAASVDLLQKDPFAAVLIGQNWRIGVFYADEWFRRFAPPRVPRGLDENESLAMATAALTDAIDGYAKWICDFVAKESRRADEGFDVGRRRRGLARLITKALGAACGEGGLSDADFDLLYAAEPEVKQREARTTPGGDADIESVRLFVKGSPFFLSDDVGRMTWRPLDGRLAVLLR